MATASCIDGIITTNNVYDVIVGVGQLFTPYGRERCGIDSYYVTIGSSNEKGGVCGCSKADFCRSRAFKTIPGKSFTRLVVESMYVPIAGRVNSACVD